MGEGCLDALQISLHSCFSAGIIPRTTWPWVQGYFSASQQLCEELTGVPPPSYQSGHPLHLHLFYREKAQKLGYVELVYTLKLRF